MGRGGGDQVAKAAEDTKDDEQRCQDDVRDARSVPAALCQG